MDTTYQQETKEEQYGASYCPKECMEKVSEKDIIRVFIFMVILIPFGYLTYYEIYKNMFTNDQVDFYSEIELLPNSTVFVDNSTQYLTLDTLPGPSTTCDDVLVMYNELINNDVTFVDRFNIGLNTDIDVCNGGNTSGLNCRNIHTVSKYCDDRIGDHGTYIVTENYDIIFINTTKKVNLIRGCAAKETFYFNFSGSLRNATTYYYSCDEVMNLTNRTGVGYFDHDQFTLTPTKHSKDYINSDGENAKNSSVLGAILIMFLLFFVGMAIIISYTPLKKICERKYQCCRGKDVTPIDIPLANIV